MIRRNVAAGVVLAAVGIFVTRQVQTLGYLDEFGPGPGFLPFWLGVLMAVLASFLAFTGLRAGKEVRKPEPGVRAESPRRGRALLAALSLVAMAAALEALGFLVSFALLSFFLVYAIERRSIMGAITVAVALTLSFFLLFRIMIPVPLPLGPWGF